jgi:hypothetical protein
MEEQRVEVGGACRKLAAAAAAAHRGYRLEVLATLTLGSRFVEIFGGGVGSPSRRLRDTTREPRCKLLSLKTPSRNYTINLVIGSSLFLAPYVHKLCKKRERDKLNTFPLSFGYWNML